MFLTLFIILTVAAVKDAYADRARHKSDQIVNNRGVLRMSSDGDAAKWETVPWFALEVGDTVRLKADEDVPADLVALWSSEEGGVCFVDTSDLDGENNLKQRIAEPTLGEQLNQVAQSGAGPASSPLDSAEMMAALAELRGTVMCEAPNTNLEKLDGNITVEKGRRLAGMADSTPLNNSNVLLRGCILRNTKEAVGLVVYTGPDTKTMMNTGPTPFKRTQVDHRLDRLILMIFVGYATICGICAVTARVWLANSGEEFNEAYNWLLTKPFESGFLRKRYESSDMMAFLLFWSYFILMNSLIPISLYVSIEFIRLGQSLFIEFDYKMFDETQDTWAKARSMSLNEELGQIDYVFSDKTGTLTRNIMTFRQCAIAGEIYGSMREDELADSRAETGVPENAAEFIDAALHKALHSDLKVNTFFQLMAVCHTVRAEDGEDGEKVYNAESPDEKALVDAARDAGFVFVQHVGGVTTILADGKPLEFKVLETIEFDSTRKRMSIIVRGPGGQVVVYSKGADSIMFGRLANDARTKAEQEALGMDLDAFAATGLRTLVMCAKTVPEDEYADWSNRYRDAKTALEDRDTKMEALADEMERGFHIVGASAIEDRLQLGVPETIVKLKDAGIKVWVLTGDKLETALNIGASCGLLADEMAPFFIIDGGSPEEVAKQLESSAAGMTARRTGADEGEILKFAIVITGPALTFLLPAEANELDDLCPDGTKRWTPVTISAHEELELKFVALAKQCGAVLCCRVSPLQKAKIVNVIKRREKCVSLAIGDGANDVSMIKTAHIGVGISGLEGRQAVNNSDYSIAQFRFLGRLLLVHGRWSYFRMCRFLRYFFYKSFVFAISTQFWWAFYNGGSAANSSDPFTVSMYSVIFSSLPVIIVGLLEQDVDEKASVDFPVLYEAGPKNLYFTFSKISIDIGRAFYHSVIVFYFATSWMWAGGQYDSSGLDASNYATMYCFLTSITVVVVNLQLAIEIKHWTLFHLFSVLLGPVMWYYMIGIRSSYDDWAGLEYVSKFHGAISRGLEMPQYWAAFCIVLVVALGPPFLMTSWQAYFHPTPIDAVNTQVKARAGSKRERQVRNRDADLDYDTAPVLHVDRKALVRWRLAGKVALLSAQTSIQRMIRAGGSARTDVARVAGAATGTKAKANQVAPV